ncbi:hypothetical protein AURDEDRAFT_187012 [Auricularia subglabra TFB-10046 SS5]|nr:hypothetical protein AURDEDRAFT_187012 [Auricularia subglabra TFB-10046 SS5]
MSAPGTPTLQRRLSARRGSMSAPDPYALHAEAETERAMTSRLTIVRVPSQHGSEDSAPQSPVSRRSSWGSSAGGRSSPGSTGSGRGRMSFAFSTFTPINPAASAAAATVPEPPVKQRTYSSSSLGRRPALSPQELVELAQNPTAGSGSPATTPSARTPAPFTPLPADVLLPFVDRPAEVAQLVATPPTSKLYALLGQSLPESGAPDQPEHWGIKELAHHLTAVRREELDDRAWIKAAQGCIAAKSELLWERFKNALGVPPDYDEELEEELEVDDEAVDDEYDEPLDDSEEDEVWVEPIYTAADLGAQVGSPVVENKSGSEGGGSFGGMEVLDEREEESPPPPKPDDGPIQGIRIYTSALPVHPPPRSARSFSHSATGAARSASFSQAQSAQTQRRFSSGLHMNASGLGRSNTTGRMRGVMHQPHTDRSPGNPLFVSSFATLSVGPTLVANNPQLRYAQRQFASNSAPVSRHGSVRVPSRLRPGRDEYAVSATSGSEREFA